jgi:tetraacyldisaccharide 4'-kinase
MTPRNLLRPIEALYGLGQRIDAARKHARAYRSPLPVISVGNLSVGGTGKTPVVAYLTSRLESSWPPLILSRGYGRRRTAPVLWRAGEPLPAPLLIGDEPALLARRMHRGAIGVAVERAAYLKSIEHQFAGSVVILDDGFQHYALARDLDIVIIDDRTAAGTALLPVGYLREPPRGPARADVVLVRSERAGEFATRWADPSAAIFRFKTVPARPERWDLPGELYDGRRVVAVSGIARPERFSASLRTLHVDVASSLPYPDHRRYGPVDVREIRGAMARAGADSIVTTAKDAVKLEAFAELAERIYVVDLGVAIEREDELLKIVRAAIEKRIGIT